MSVTAMGRTTRDSEFSCEEHKLQFYYIINVVVVIVIIRVDPEVPLRRLLGEPFVGGGSIFSVFNSEHVLPRTSFTPAIFNSCRISLFRCLSDIYITISKISFH